MIGTIDTGQRLQKVVFLDDTPQILLFQAGGIKAGEQHIKDHQQINFSFLKIILVSPAGFLVVHIVQDQHMTDFRVAIQCFFHCAGLVGGIADDHAANRRIPQRNTAVHKILYNVVHQRGHIFRMCVDVFLFERTLLHFQTFQNRLQLYPVFSLNALSDEFQGIAVSNRAVVIIFMDIFSKNVFCVVAFANQGSPSKRDHNRLTV